MYEFVKIASVMETKIYNQVKALRKQQVPFNKIALRFGMTVHELRAKYMRKRRQMK